MKFVTLLCCINPSVESKDISELTVFKTVSAVAPVRNLKLIGSQGQIKAFVQVENQQVAEWIIGQLNGQTVEYGKMKVFLSHKKFVAFEKPLQKVLAEAAGVARNPKFACRSGRTNDFSHSGSSGRLGPGERDLENSDSRNAPFENSKNQGHHFYESFENLSKAKIDSLGRPYGAQSRNMTNTFDRKDTLATENSGENSKTLTDPDSWRTVVLRNIRTDRVSCQMLFNLFGCFGNIHRLWFVEDEKMVLIEYEQPAHAEMVARSADLVPYFDDAMRIRLVSEAQAFECLDRVREDRVKFVKGSFKFYRYKDDTARPIKAFTKTLHFTNVSNKLTCESLCRVISELHTPIRLVEGQFRARAEQSYIVEFEEYQQCLEVLSLLHNRKVEGRKLNVEFIDMDISGALAQF